MSNLYTIFMNMKLDHKIKHDYEKGERNTIYVYKTVLSY
jgi:hypothetical protein